MTFLRRRVTPLLLAVSLAAAAGAAPDAPRDLGGGLAYFRVHALADDAETLASALAGGGALVLDVRHATARGEDAPVLARALAQRRSPALLCVLVSPATPPALADVLAAAAVPLVTLGVAGSVPPARVVIAQPVETDQRAYAALDSGTPLADLTSGRIKKERYDEVSLMNDFTNGNTAGEPPPEPDLQTAKGPPAAPPALIDRVLQRAIDLDRALAAIQRRS